MKARCLQQFASAPASGHHRLTRRFLDPDFPSSLRPDIDMMGENGSNMSPRLAAAVSPLAWSPLDDCVCEGPHAQAKRIKSPASSAKWTWVAASMRLAQNIKDCRALPEQTATSLRAVWSNWASVVQPPSKAGRTPRLKPRQLQRNLYRLDHVLGFRAQASVTRAALQDEACGPGLGRAVPLVDAGMSDEEGAAPDLAEGQVRRDEALGSLDGGRCVFKRTSAPIREASTFIPGCAMMCVPGSLEKPAPASLGTSMLIQVHKRVVISDATCCAQRLRVERSHGAKSRGQNPTWRHWVSGIVARRLGAGGSKSGSLLWRAASRPGRYLSESPFQRQATG